MPVSHTHDMKMPDTKLWTPRKSKITKTGGQRKRNGISNQTRVSEHQAFWLKQDLCVQPSQHCPEPATLDIQLQFTAQDTGSLALLLD